MEMYVHAVEKLHQSIEIGENIIVKQLIEFEEGKILT